MWAVDFGIEEDIAKQFIGFFCADDDGQNFLFRLFTGTAINQRGKSA